MAAFVSRMALVGSWQAGREVHTVLLNGTECQPRALAVWQLVPCTKVHKLKVRRHRAPWTRAPSHQCLRLREPPHPLIIHIHGYDFYIVAEGLGNFNAATDTPSSTSEDLLMRSAGGVPVNGWAVIRFVADNPGVWLMLCHLDVHITWGLAMAFLVEDGVGPPSALPPPDLPLLAENAPQSITLNSTSINSTIISIPDSLIIIYLDIHVTTHSRYKIPCGQCNSDILKQRTICSKT